jgi:hypothetical protein
MFSLKNGKAVKNKFANQHFFGPCNDLSKLPWHGNMKMIPVYVNLFVECNKIIVSLEGNSTWLQTVANSK